MSNAINERASFSLRLRLALQAAQYLPDRPTQLARNFNERSSGHQITVHAARKWLVGEAIPTQEKLRILAEWLDVPINWLRYGNGDDAFAAACSRDRRPLSPSELHLVSDLLLLDAQHQKILHDFAKLLLKGSRYVQRNSEDKSERQENPVNDRQIRGIIGISTDH